MARHAFPGLGIISTVDVLFHPRVRQKLGEAAFAGAMFAALRDARMTVFPHQIEDILGIIGPERAAQCVSLPKRFRLSIPKPAGEEVERSG